MKTIVATLLFFGVLGSAWAGPRHQVGWEPNRYKVAPCYHQNCQSDQFKKWAEDALEDATTRFKAMGWRAVSNFGPVVGQGANAYVAVGDVNKSSYAYAEEVCGPGSTSTMSFGRRSFEIEKLDYAVYFFFVHELFHIIQYAYDPFKGCNQQRRGGWVSEGTATDVALAFARDKFPNRFPLASDGRVTAEVMDRLLRTLTGLRRYDLPLDHNDAVRTGSVIHYRTQSFWRHLAEVYHSGSRKYLQGYFARDVYGDDWLRWLSANVKTSTGLDLGVVYTLFLADYTGWGDRGLPGQAIGPKRWIENSFAKCQTLELSPNDPAQILDLTLQRTSGTCIEVTVLGVTDEQRISIKAAAVANTMEQADQLNLGLAKSSGKTEFHCARKLRTGTSGDRLMARFRCLFLGNNGHIRVGDSKRWARVWDTLPQYPRQGLLSNTYVITRVAVTPSSKPQSGDGGDAMKFRLAFAADFSEKKVAGKVGAKKTVAHLNEEPIHNAQEQVPKHNQSGGISMPLLYPHAPKQNIVPPIPLHPPSASNKKGIWLLRVSEVDVKDDGLFTESLTPGDQLEVYPLTADGKSPLPLQVGDTGSFRANIAGKKGWLGVYSKEPARLTVHRFDPFVLNATVEGTICDAPLGSGDVRQCANPRSVSLRIIKGLAGFHHPDNKYVVLDTPSTQQLRNHVSIIMNLYTGGAPSAAAEAGGASSAAASSTGYEVKGPYSSKVQKIGNCNCTCNDRHHLGKLQADLDSGKEKESPALLRHVMSMASCMRTCTPYYLSDECKKKN